MASFKVAPPAVTPRTRPPFVTSRSPFFFSARVENGRPGGFGVFNSGDHVARPRFAGISFCGQNDADGASCSRNPDQSSLRQPTEAENLAEISLEAVHQCLCFGIAQPNIKFENFGPFGSHHHACV